MIIIVCGIDKSGKSTIIKDLISKYQDAVVIKLSSRHKPKTNDPTEIWNVKIAYEELFHQARVISSQQNRHVIFDRAYPSELVYSIKRGYDAMDDLFWWDLDEQLSKFEHTLLVYCWVPDDVGLKRMKEEKEEYLQEHEYTEIKKRYNDFLSRSKLQKIEVRTDQDRKSNLEKVSKTINDLEHHEH